jgi:hypothetical protein
MRDKDHELNGRPAQSPVWKMADDLHRPHADDWTEA